jgi:phage/plasmid-like protein (TIGR03299 family)
MAHEIEYREDLKQWSFAFTGDRSAIWHKKGQNLIEGASQAEWMDAAGHNFEVEKIDLRKALGAFHTPNGDTIEETPWLSSFTHALQRSDNGTILSVVSSDWHPAQNSQAYAFAQPFIDAGFATLNTAGTLFDGRRCFILLKTNEGFSLPSGDDTEGYVLVQMSHEYGIADLVLPTSVRVVCNNTLQFALQKAHGKGQIDAGKFVHRAKTAFSVEKANALIAAYKLGLGAYAEQAKFLSTRKATPEQTRAYINKVFKLEEMKDGSVAEVARRRAHNDKVVTGLLSAIERQPGANMSAGSWWAAFHGTTWHEDHGRWEGKDEPITAKFTGVGAERKQVALRLALEMATAA